MVATPTWPKVNNPFGTTVTQFGALDWANLISDYYNGVNIGLVDATKIPLIGTLTRYQFEKLALFDVDASHLITFSPDDIDTGADRKIKIRRMNSPYTDDYMVLEQQTAELFHKTISGSNNTFVNVPYASISGLPSAFVPISHATSHKTGGSDTIKLDELAAPTDITTLNATTSLHGLLKKLDNTSTNFMNGQGNWAVPVGVPGVINTLTDVDTVTAAPTNNQVLTWNSTSSQWVPATPPGSSGGEANTTSNTGTGEGTLALAKSGVNLPFKSLKQGTNITLTNNANDVTIASTGGGATNLDALTDVVITSPATQQIVYYNGTNFINSTSTPFKSGPELYRMYVDAADSKFKVINMDTLAIEFTSSGTTDVLATFNSMIAAASTAKRPCRIDKGLYLFSAAPTIAGKWIRITGTRVSKTPNGSRGDPTTETVLKKAYTDATNPFIDWNGLTTWTQQIWEDIVIEGKDSTNNGVGTFDDGGIGFQIKSAVTGVPAISEIYDCFRNVTICHFGTGLKLMKCYQLTFHDLCIYKCSSKGIYLTNDGTGGQCFEIRFNGGEVRFAPTNIHIEKADHTKIESMMLEGDSASPYTQVNSVKIDSEGINTRLWHCSFENNVNAITTISDGGLGTTIDSCRFGGLTWTTQTVYNATSTCAKGNFINNTIEPYANNGAATILLSSASKHMNIIGNHVQQIATNTSLTITDSSGNSQTNLILGNTSGANVVDNTIGRATTFLSSPTVIDSTANFAANLLTLYKANTTLYLDWGIAFDAQDTAGTRRTFSRIYTTSDDIDVALEDSWIAFDYRVDGALTQRGLFYNNGIAVGIPGQRVRLESSGLTANRVYSTPDKNGILSINTPTYVRKGATANRRYVAGLRQNADAALLTSTTAPAINTLWAMPLLVTQPTKFDTITCQVTTLGSGSNIRMGIYADDGTGSYPGALIYDSGSISSATTGAKETTITAGVQLFQPGMYWIAFECSATAPQIRILPGVGNYIAFGGYDNTLSTTAPQFAWSVAHTLGALPNPYTASATAITTPSAAGTPIPAVGLRSIT